MPAIIATNPKALYRFLILWFPVVLCMGTIFYFSSLPANDIPPIFPYDDIVFHFSIYSILGFSFSRAIKETKACLPYAKIIVLACFLGLLYGISDELHQALAPGRNVSGFDVLMDCTGSFFGSVFYVWLK